MVSKTLIRSLLLSALLPLVPLTSEAAPKAEAPASPAQNPAGFVIRRGTNLSHWLSQDFGNAPREAFITENDIRFIARCGFDHVRIPVDEKELWTEAGKPIEAAFTLLDRALDWCHAHKLRAIVDLHTIRSHHFNAENEGGTNTLFSDPAQQEHFLTLWDQLSARLVRRPISEVAYEIMNEPVADKHEDWNALVARAVARLRAKEPNRVLVIGANRWQIPGNVPFLKVPEGDRNIILSMHTYSPFLFTHYKAEWVPIKVYTGPVQYPGPVLPKADYDKLRASANQSMTDLSQGALDNWGPERLRAEYEPAIRRARELGLQLYCGEFGCLPTVPRADRLAYYRDIVGVFEAEGMAWANWEYKADFGIFEWHGTKYQGGAPDVELIDALFQRK